MKWGPGYLFGALILQSLLIYVQGFTGPGGSTRTAEMRVEFEVKEELPIGILVGRIPIKPGFTYRFNEHVEHFKINGTTGEIKTAAVIDREALQEDTFDLVVLSSQPTYPVEVRIRILDLNDHSPSFPEPRVRVTFSESSTPGTRVFLDTADDPDMTPNGVTDDYRILDGNEDSHFQLTVSTNPSGEAPFLYLETTGKLDRESKSFYQLNISAQDNGLPPKIGFVLVEVDVIDTNDNPPIFDHSDYVVSLNESVPFGTPVLQVMATDSDEGDNSKITYYLSETETQFNVDPETGDISTAQSSLNCQQSCPNKQPSCFKSCVFTVFARDHGVPRQDGRTYVTVILLDANDHDPVIQFKYFPDTASAASVDENAQNGSVVAAVSTSDRDEGLNGDVVVQIVSGNELMHFRLESAPYTQIVRVNDVLDRERIGKYNLSIMATDKGTPPRSSMAFLLIEVNDVNDHAPIFQQTEYAAVLRELVPIGWYVASISAHDEDTGINSQLYYSIVSGNENDWFVIDTESGLLTTKAQLDREQKDAVRLKISARDGGPNPKWAYSEIKITILDENDEHPKFENEKVDVSLAESVPLGSLITTISASDHDQGTNGSVSYHLDSSVEELYPGVFYLDPNSGVLVNKLKFDRESVPVYEILVIAKDKGSPSLSSTATISLKILDTNDNDPIIYPTQYFISLPKSTPGNKEVLQVKATDADEGSNANLVFGIQSDKSNYFSIEGSTGIIRLQQDFWRINEDYVTFSAYAIDEGGRRSADDAMIHIFRVNETHQANHSLKFRWPITNFTLTEDPGIQKAGEQFEPRRIGRLELGSVNMGGGKGQTKYAIVDGDPNYAFRIDNEGILYSIKSIDRELNPEFKLSVIAWNQFAKEYAKCTANILVSDLNDNAPIFVPKWSEVEIDEDAAIGSEVVLVQVTDADHGENSTVRFSLTQNPEDMFLIDPVNGLVTLRQILIGRLGDPPSPNSEKYNKILTLEVMAADGGTPPLSSRQQIRVKVKDVNNFTPVFDHSSYETALLESTPLNSRFFTLRATDQDIGPNAQVSFEILDGTGADKFGIFPDGNLFVKKMLDREDQDYYTLTVLAKDGGRPPRSSTVPVIIHVDDENDNRPRFLNSTFTFFITENEEPDTFVGKLTAIDVDGGRNAELTYSISSAQRNFMVEPRSGFIRSLKSFDREHVLQNTGKDFLTLDVVVQDGGTPRLKDTTLVKIYIEDENDNSPIFLKKAYTAQVSEGAAVGSQVLRVHATDADQELNGIIMYYFSNSDSDEANFRIDPVTGQITVARHLDRESVSEYTLTVVAQDMPKTHSLSSTALVTIEILDENDNAPEFAQSEPFISVLETAGINRELMQFQASDPDLGQNQQVSLAITGGNKHDVFRIDSKTGSLYLNKPLDFEKQSTYTLNITASDSGSPKLSTSIQFVVKVEDFNDNPPVFPSTAIFRQIQEGIPINSSIVTITVDDPDSGLNGKVKYSISDQEPPGEFFGIDPEDGRIFTLREIDREFTDSFRMTVVATDQAIPISNRLSAEKLVTIIVDDINDNEPRFTCMNAAILRRETQVSSEIIKVQAIDLDSESNGAVTYEMVNGDASLFTLNRKTGSLSLRSSIWELQPRYQMTIRATDEAIQSQRKSSDLYLTILGIESKTDGRVNGSLAFSSESYQGFIYENEPVGTSILHVNSVTGVEKGEIEYYITNITSTKSRRIQDRLFEIDVRKGTIYTTAGLDREMGVFEFQLEVYAILISSSGRHTGTVLVNIQVLDRNDSPPRFREAKKHMSISESSPVHTDIVTLVATDDDTLGNVTYSITQGNDGHKFRIDKETGVLRLSDPLDREERDEFLLVIRATDGIQHSDMRLSIKVLDENDNVPAFSNHGIYSFDIPEDAALGVSVGGLEAVDPDKGVNGVITYSVLSDWGNDVFALNPESGIFTLTNRVDYENVQHYVFVVQAQDSGVPSLSSTATVYINIIDLNDNAPVFDPMSYAREVFENISIGSSVVTLSATDLDSGVNGEITYSIQSGNEDRSFDISDNGTIFTRKTLDRETTATYNLIIKASDRGLPFKLSSLAQVSISLRDINDEIPVFVSPNETTVMENQHLNTVVMVVKAVNRDEGRKGYVEYVLNNERATFTLGPVDGLLRVNGIIDRESNSNYTLLITAKDRGEPPRSSTQTLLVKIDDVNDNSPTFDPRQYSAAISENSSLGMSVLQVSATDVDDGLNGQIRFGIMSGDPNHDFVIDDDTGVIRLSKGLNFERQQLYTLTIHAEDFGVEPQFDTATVVISIINTNDNPPVFLDSPYVAQVRENMDKVPVSVIRVNAYDADANPNQQIRYLMKDGDKGTFRINTSTGEITVHRKLDREVQSEYLLTVVAMDAGSPRLTGTGMVRISVVDTNDNLPLFEHQRYEFSVQGNSRPGTNISRVFASDADEGLNGEIRYFLHGKGPFLIDQVSGEIKTTAEIDRQTQQVFRLTVEARDSNPITPLHSFANVTIRVENPKTDVHIFKGFKGAHEYSVTIPDGSGAGTFIYGLSPEDMLFGMGRRYFLGGLDADKFNINQETGVVTTLRSLRMVDGVGSYQVEINGNDPLVKDPISSVIVLRVELSNSKGFPGARAKRTSFTFSESVRNVSITRIELLSPKPGVTFAIGGGNVGNAFEVDKETGEVRISQIGLDYEVAKEYELWILVKIESRRTLVTALPLHIAVTDENDNEPIFEKSSYELTISEEEMGPKYIATLLATDADSGSGGQVRYRLSKESESAFGQLFSIEKTSGEIFSKVKLDREEVSHYALTVEAVDLGNPPQSGTTSVLIIVNDKNDNPPRFTRLFSVNVTENSPIGTFVIQVTSVDKDVGANANCSYVFTENHANPFRIDPLSGNITVTGILDREVQDEYLIRVAAIDGSWRAETLVTITIQDLNDNSPEFEQSFYSFNIAEGKEHVSFVGQVIASDRDKRGSNSMVTYELKHPSDFFSMDPLTGEIFTKRTLHYKITRRKESPENEHKITVMATDRGKPPLSSDVFVSINIVDANNSPPQFAKSEYAVSVLETQKPGERVTRMEAKDTKDIGFNALIEYFLVGGNGTDLFSIDKSNGWVVLNSDLSGKRLQKYALTVRAVDKGIPPLSADVPLYLTVTGPNNHAPVLSSLSYRVIVPENEALGTVIVTLTAADQDTGPNGEIEYNITGGNEGNQFQIHATSGAVSIRQSLDYELQKEYRLNITASDKAYYRLQTEVEVTVLLADTNDNPPLFPKSSYKAEIKENAPVHTPLLQLRAVDKDSAKYAQIHYAIIGGSGKNEFQINQTTGLIVSRISFNYEDRREFILEVMASNPDSNLFGTTQVIVNILGVNEYFPRFVQPIFQFVVSESAGLGHQVGQVEATDEDSGPDGQIYYWFLGSSIDRGFAVDVNTGAITVSRRLNHETQSRVVLSVLAKNFGSIRGNDIDEAQIIITIQDGNDPPVFEKEVYALDVSEGVPVGTHVVSVAASDIDARHLNNPFSYEILDGNDNNRFRIDVGTGRIETATNLDRETQSSYRLTIGAVDIGEPPQTGTTTVQITVLDENDNGPILEASSARGSILENEPPGTKIMTLRAIDPDLPPNSGPFIFSLVADSESPKVKIDSKSGLITSLVTFDREIIPDFKIQVKIQDGGRPARTTTNEVHIFILDLNDNPSQARDGEVLILTFKDEVPRSEETVAVYYPIDPDVTGKYTCRLEGNSVSGISIKSDCRMVLNKIPRDGKQSLKIISNDGRHKEVTSTATVQVTTYEKKSLDNSILIAIGGGLNQEQFLEKSFPRLRSLFNRIFRSEAQFLGFLRPVNSTDLILALGSLGHETRKELAAAVLPHKRSIEEILEVPVTLNYSPCASTCLNEAPSCTFNLRAIGSRSIVQSPLVILSSPTLEVDVTCTCALDFEGPECQFRKDPCSPNPCHHMELCTRSGHDFHCACPPSRHGKRCELEQKYVNPCASNPCRNGGTCNQDQSDGSSYFCLCRPGFLGKTCSVSAADACQPNPCLNGGECVGQSSGSVQRKCICKNQFYGKYCEKSSVGFSSGSFMSFPPLDPNTNDISIVFSTNKQNSLLMYNYGEHVGGRSDFIALELLDGKPRLGFGGSRTAVGSVALQKFVADGKWYRILAIRNGKAISLSVSECEENGGYCSDCPPGNPSCYVSDVGHTGSLSFNGNPVYIGGLKNVHPLLERPGQIHTDDFVGCMHSLEINGKALNISAPLASNGITDTCQRIPDVCSPGKHACGLEGTCIDLWDSHTCRCLDVIAPNCDQALSSATLKEGGFIEFSLGEKYRRHQLLQNLLHKYRDEKSKGEEELVSIDFRTTQPNGVIFFAATNNDYTLLELQNGDLSFSTKMDRNYPINMTMHDVILFDGKWHTARLQRHDQALKLYINGQQWGEELNSASSHNFLDPYLTILALGGVPQSYFGPSHFLSSLDGCIGNFVINENLIPLNSSGGLMEGAFHNGHVELGCSNAMRTSSSPDPLSIGVTLVIIFFTVLLVAILVSFVVFRLRKTEKSPLPQQTVPIKSTPTSQTEVTRQNKMRSNEAETIRGFVRNAKKKGDGPMGYQTPDIIERSNSGPTHNIPSPPRHNLANIVSMEPDASELPEHYDLENASSIAPSDIDIVYHYKGYREQTMGGRTKSPPFGHNHHFSVHAQSPRMMRQSPSSNGLKSTPLARLSPSSELSQQTGPRILTLQDISGKPYQSALLHQKDVISQSERSLNMSQSSGRSSMLNRSCQAKKKRKKCGGERSSNVSIGLTAEEIERLNNSRQTNNSSLISTMDAVSSSESDEQKHEAPQQKLPYPRVPPSQNTTSDEEQSENDSFSCSEFEFDRKRGNYPHHQTPHLVYPQNAQAKNNPVTDESFRGSLSTLVASDDDLAYIGGYRKSSLVQNERYPAESWNYSNSWSRPNYSPLTSVFKNIPEGSEATASPPIPAHSSNSMNNLGSSSRGGPRYPNPRPSEEYV